MIELAAYSRLFVLVRFAGNLTLRAYEEDCEFADPAGSFRGLQRFKRNCTNFGSLLEKSNMKLTKWEDLLVFRAICHVLLLISDEKNTDMCCLLLAASCCRTNHQLGTGVSAASCHSRGGLFYQVIVPIEVHAPLCTSQRLADLFQLFIFAPALTWCLLSSAYFSNRIH